MNRSLAAAAAIVFVFAAAACAPRGFVETTANVIDEMTAFRQAREANTRAAWQSFIDQYPDSQKAQQARQWLDAMPSDSSAENARMQAEVAKAEAERAAREQAAQDEAAKQAALKAQQEQEAQRIAQEKAQQQALVAQAQQVQVSTQAAALIAELQEKMKELDQREAELAAREAALDASATKAAADPDVDVPPSGGLPQSPENFAVVIGIDKYRDIGAEADYAERDARSMMLYLRDYLGFPEQNIKLLTGAHAAGSDFRKILELWLPLQVTPESKVFVFYSGHGAPDAKNSQAYLLPYDGDPNALALTGYPLKKLYADLDALPAKETLVALDSCFSGAGGRSVVARGARPLITHVQTGLLDPKKNVTVFAAASGDQITGAYDPQKHGLFTYYFLRGLRGEADANKDGWVTVDEEYAYLKKNVTIQANRDSREQTPQLLPEESLVKGRGDERLAKVSD
ncbi:MAG: caspase family protein [Elusimicrobia bacterium]|nr:caspase family protein [Elusimicrobiota bacterium]